MPGILPVFNCFQAHRFSHDFILSVCSYSLVIETVEMMHIKAFKGAEIHRFDINPGTTFGELKELVYKLFGLGKDVTVAINYRDRDGDLIMLSSDEELQTALRHLDEEETWHLQVILQHKQQQQPL